MHEERRARRWPGPDDPEQQRSVDADRAPCRVADAISKAKRRPEALDLACPDRRVPNAEHQAKLRAMLAKAGGGTDQRQEVYKTGYRWDAPRARRQGLPPLPVRSGRPLPDHPSQKGHPMPKIPHCWPQGWYFTHGPRAEPATPPSRCSAPAGDAPCRNLDVIDPGHRGSRFQPTCRPATRPPRASIALDAVPARPVPGRAGARRPDVPGIHGGIQVLGTPPYATDGVTQYDKGEQPSRPTTSGFPIDGTIAWRQIHELPKCVLATLRRRIQKHGGRDADASPCRSAWAHRGQRRFPAASTLHPREA